MNSQRAESQIGDAVFCRDHENRSWLSGVIVSLKPLEIQVQGWPIAMSFHFVRQNDEGKIGCSLLEPSDAEPTASSQSDSEEMLFQTYSPGLYRIKVSSFVRKELDGTTIRKLVIGALVDVKSLELCQNGIRAEIRQGGFVTLYDFIKKRELATKVEKHSVLRKRWTKYVPFPKYARRLLIGKKGEKINAIRASSNAHITVFDKKTRIVDEKATKLSQYYCVVRIKGSEYQVSCAINSIRELRGELPLFSRRRRAYSRRRRRRPTAPTEYISFNSNRTYQFALRGKRRKKKHHRQQSKKNHRKPNRKYTIEVANNRRLSL